MLVEQELKVVGCLGKKVDHFILW